MARKNKAQTMFEYALIIVAIVGALLAMSVYFVRALQGKYRQSADVFGLGEQYAKYRTVETRFDPGEDFSSNTTNPAYVCSEIVARVNIWENEAVDFNQQATALEEKASAMETGPLANPLIGEEAASQLRAAIAQMRQQAATRRTDASFRIDAAANFRNNHPDCF